MSKEQPSDEKNWSKTLNYKDQESREDQFAKLVVVEGKANVEVQPLTSDKTTFGRKPDNDLVLDSEYVSKYHGQVIREGERFLLEDLNSTGGITINSVKLEPGKKLLLSHGDAIQVVKHVLLFCQAGSFTDRQGLSSIFFDRSKVLDEVDAVLSQSSLPGKKK